MKTSTAADSRQLKRIFDRFPDGIITIKNGGAWRVSSINETARRLLSIPASSVDTDQITRALRTSSPALFQLARESIMRERVIKNFVVEHELGNGDGQSKTLLVNTAMLDDGGARAREVILVLHDISDATQHRRHQGKAQEFEALIGKTAKMLRVFSQIATVAPYDTAVLIYGETGTGKELVARAIHARSPRARGPFVPVHCSALASSLLESDLFGHVKGAFTGAVKNKPGRFEMAAGGTIFLDEVATLSPEIQIKLLRVLQEKTIERVGGTGETSVDVRIISATNRRLPELIQSNTFRKDFYYRIKVVQIELPALRDRKSDIPVLAEAFIDKFNRQHHKRILNISAAAHRLMRKYPWPGNVRELENAIEHAVIFSQGSTIEPHCLPPELSGTRQVHEGAGDASAGRHTIKMTIQAALQESGGNMTRAARLLGIHRSTLWRKMKEFRISRPRD